MVERPTLRLCGLYNDQIPFSLQISPRGAENLNERILNSKFRSFVLNKCLNLLTLKVFVGAKINEAKYEVFSLGGEN